MEPQRIRFLKGAGFEHLVLIAFPSPQSIGNTVNIAREIIVDYEGECNVLLRRRIDVQELV